MPINPMLLTTAILAMVDDVTKEMYLESNPDMAVLLGDRGKRNSNESEEVSEQG